MSHRSRELLETGRPHYIEWSGRRIAAWQWGGDNGQAVYLVHGWGGSGSLAEFAGPLMARGLRVIAFDAPGHGRSENGPSGWRQSNFLEFSGVLQAAVRAFGPADGLIAHSGCVASTALALRDGLRVGRVAFLASFTDPEHYTGVFASALGIGAGVIDAMRQRAATRLGFRWEDLNVATLAQFMNVPRALIVHDREDVETPWAGAAEIAAAWPSAILVSTSGLGHHKLLRDPEVLRRVVEFLGNYDRD